MRPKTCTITVDLDPLRFYEQIHGLSAKATSECPIYSTALKRLSEWSRDLSIPVTWFVVGQELDAPSVVSRLRERHSQGDELANHSESHLYDLTRKPSATINREVETTIRRLSRITGENSFGFRAPGYRITDELVNVLKETNTLYDSSVFPCPTYWLAKAMVLTGQRVLGRRSRSILDHPKVLFGPRLPYKMGRSYLHRGDCLVEYPITVTPRFRLPFIGTTLCLMGKTTAVSVTRAVCGQAFVNLELHGIDALDRNDGLEYLATVQPDLRIKWERKLGTLSAVISVLRRAGFTFVTLRDVTTAQSF